MDSSTGDSPGVTLSCSCVPPPSISSVDVTPNPSISHDCGARIGITTARSAVINRFRTRTLTLTPDGRIRSATFDSPITRCDNWPYSVIRADSGENGRCCLAHEEIGRCRSSTKLWNCYRSRLMSSVSNHSRSTESPIFSVNCSSRWSSPRQRLQGRSTPLRRPVSNPFDTDDTLDRLDSYTFSPSVFATILSPSEVEDSYLAGTSSASFGGWSIDHVAVMNPAEIDEFPLHQHLLESRRRDPAAEEAEQLAITRFFSQSDFQLCSPVADENAILTSTDGFGFVTRTYVITATTDEDETDLPRCDGSFLAGKPRFFISANESSLINDGGEIVNDSQQPLNNSNISNSNSSVFAQFQSQSSVEESGGSGNVSLSSLRRKLFSCGEDLFDPDETENNDADRTNDLDEDEGAGGFSYERFSSASLMDSPQITFSSSRSQSIFEEDPIVCNDVRNAANFNCSRRLARLGSITPPAGGLFDSPKFSPVGMDNPGKRNHSDSNCSNKRRREGVTPLTVSNSPNISPIQKSTVLNGGVNSSASFNLHEATPLSTRSALARRPVYSSNLNSATVIGLSNSDSGVVVDDSRDSTSATSSLNCEFGAPLNSIGEFEVGRPSCSSPVPDSHDFCEKHHPSQLMELSSVSANDFSTVMEVDTAQTRC